jgi:hypothetical protein
MAFKEARSLTFFITPREPQRLRYSRPPDESWAKSSLQDESLELSAERGALHPHTLGPTCYFKNRDNEHFEGPGSSPSFRVKSYYDLPQCLPTTSASTNPFVGPLLQFFERAIWVQSSNIHASQYCQTIQPTAMAQLSECGLGCGDALLYWRNASRLRR